MRLLKHSILVLLGSASLASAATLINVDVRASGVSTYTGAEAIGTAGDFWNTFIASGTTGNGPTALNWSDNTVSGISMTLGAGINNSSNTGSGGDAMMASYAWLFHNNGVANSTTITLSGFASNQVVNSIYLYGANGFGQFSQFTIGSTTLSTTDTGSVGSPLTEGDEYVKFTNVVADGTGAVLITWTDTAGSGNKWATLNGLQIQTVPEPSTALLGGVGMLGLLTRRRRRVC